MLNSTALVLASNNSTATRMVDHLSATGLFGSIEPLKSPKALLRYLKTKSVDMICWAVEKNERGDRRQQRNSWIDQLQTQDRWHDLPVIAFAEDQQSLIDGFELGASDAVHVGIDTIELSARMTRHLQRWQRLVELRKSQEELQKMALTDPLTQLGNRATFDMSIKQAAARTQRTGEPYALMMIDLDHFKAFNDTHGHQVGDNILRLVANTIHTAARDSDICCRYGGEEFAIILPSTNGSDAEVLAARIHRHLKRVSQKQPLHLQPITVSIGISGTNGAKCSHARELIEEADQALYRAKRNGRNRTERSYSDINTLRGSYGFNQPQQMAYGA